MHATADVCVDLLEPLDAGLGVVIEAVVGGDQVAEDRVPVATLRQPLHFEYTLSQSIVGAVFQTTLPVTKFCPPLSSGMPLLSS